MAEFTQTIGVGVGDLQHAALAEARRIMREAKGDRGVAAVLIFERLSELGLISEYEREVLIKMHKADAESSVEQKGGRPGASAVYFEVRGMYDELLTKGGASPVALVLASGLVGSYEPVPSDDGTTVIYAKSNGNYEATLAGAGAIIGGVFGGGPGAALGGAIGGVIGKIVDDCRK
jgi:hypothetical protein